MSIVRPDGRTYRCSGSLIASKWIVTAAHCVYDASSVTVILGEHDTATMTESTIPRKEVTVSKIIPHENYVLLHDDIALLKLSESVDLSVYTPVCLPNTGDDFIGKTALVYGKLAGALHSLTICLGWGATSSSGSLSSKLLEVAVGIVSDTTCQNAFTNNPATTTWTITSGMLCAGGVGGKDSCGVKYHINIVYLIKI